MLNCKDMTKLISDSLEEKISVRRRLELWLHITMCGMCRRFRSNIIELRKRVHSSRGLLDQAAIAPTALTTAMKARLEEAIKRHID